MPRSLRPASLGAFVLLVVAGCAGASSPPSPPASTEAPPSHVATRDADGSIAPAESADDVTTAPGALTPLAVFPYRGRGSTVPDALPLHSALHVYEIACAQNEVAHTWSCAPGKGLYAELLKSSSVGLLSYDGRRTSACFKVDLRAPDAAIIKAVALAFDRNGTTETHQRGEDMLQARAATDGPSLLVIRVKSHEPGGVCHCEGRDCCLGIRFTPAEIRAGHDTSELMARASRPMAVPSEEVMDLGTVGVFDVTPKDAELLAAGRRGDWRAAVALAAADLEAPEKLPPRRRSLAWSNLAVAAFEARDLVSLKRADEAVRALGKEAHPYASNTLQVLGPAARGEMWLDDDPCAR